VANAGELEQHLVQRHCRGQSLRVISASVPTSGLAACWDVITPNGRYVYTANAMTSNLSGFEMAFNGTLTAIGATVLAENPAGSANIDTTVSQDGNFVYR